MNNYTYNAKMINVVDGDTQDFEICLGFDIKYVIRVRLKGIDTPEKFRPSCLAEKNHGLQATNFVIDHYLNTTGTLITYKDRKGKYGRYLADFHRHDGKSLIEDLKNNGFDKRDDYESRNIYYNHTFS